MNNNSVLIFNIGSKLKVLAKVMILRGKIAWIYEKIFIILFKIAHLVGNNTCDSLCSPTTVPIRYFYIYGGIL